MKSEFKNLIKFKSYFSVNIGKIYNFNIQKHKCIHSSKWKVEFTGPNQILEYVGLKKTEKFTDANKVLLVDQCSSWGLKINLRYLKKKEKNFTKFIYVAQILCQATTKMYF